MMTQEYDPQEMIDAFSQRRYDYVREHALHAADAGNADAQCMIALLYQFGAGVVHEGSEAVRWYRKAAAKDHPIAWCNLGTIYDSACGALLMSRKPEDVI
jgi:TPR repeat protein